MSRTLLWLQEFDLVGFGADTLSSGEVGFGFSPQASISPSPTASSNRARRGTSFEAA